MMSADPEKKKAIFRDCSLGMCRSIAIDASLTLEEAKEFLHKEFVKVNSLPRSPGPFSRNKPLHRTTTRRWMPDRVEDKLKALGFK